MVKWVIIFLGLGGSALAATQSVTMTPTAAIQLAGDLVERGDFDHAAQILTQTPTLGGALEIERWFLLAQMAQKNNDWNGAAKIYHKILDAQPNLARVRFELALCYMHLKKWRRADYHMRLAMAGRDLDADVRQMMNYYRYIIRQNKNWNVWFNVGVAPDNNVNNATGGTECVATIFGLMCRELGAPERAVGANFSLGGNYEFKMGDHWRWKSDATLYSNIYNKHDYDDLYLGVGSGPRYVWTNGDVWLAAIGARRWYGWEKYNWSYGAKIDANYDFTRKLSGGLSVRFMENKYDTFGEFLDGQTYSLNGRATYAVAPSMYLTTRTGIVRERTLDPAYAYWQPNAAVGIGCELPLGFHVYVEPSVWWTWYDGPRWVVYNNAFSEIAARDFTQRYGLTISNNKINIWGFVPALTVSFTRRDSNIWQRTYNKTALEFTMQQRF